MNKDEKKKRIHKIMMIVIIVVGIITFGLCVAFTIWLVKQGVDIRRFIIRPPFIYPIGLWR